MGEKPTTVGVLWLGRDGIHALGDDLRPAEPPTRTLDEIKIRIDGIARACAKPSAFRDQTAVEIGAVFRGYLDEAFEAGRRKASSKDPQAAIGCLNALVLRATEQYPVHEGAHGWWARSFPYTRRQWRRLGVAAGAIVSSIAWTDAGRLVAAFAVGFGAAIGFVAIWG